MLPCTLHLSSPRYLKNTTLFKDVGTQLSRWIRLLLGIAVTGVFLYLAVRRVDLASVVRAGSEFPWFALVPALALLTVEYGLRCVRWWWMLRICNPSIRLRSCVWPLLVSVGVNNVTPFRAGDALRVFGFRKELGTPVAQLLGTMIVERLLDVTVLLLFLLVGLLQLDSAQIPPLYGHTATLVLMVALCFWLVVIVGKRPLERIALRLCRSRIFPSRRAQAEHHIGQFLATLSIVRTPRRFIGFLAISLAIWSCDGAIFAAVAHELGYGGRPFGPWFSLATATLSTLVPSSPGYVGTFDFFSMVGLAAFGGTRAVSGAFALIVHAILWVPLTLVGILYFVLPMARRPVQRAVEPKEKHW